MTATARAKILPVALLGRVRAHLATSGATVGLCHGCFDIIHSGHMHHFQLAAREVDVLVVSVTAARYIDKGEHRPIFDDESRLATVAALATTDYAVLSSASTATALIRRLRPDVYFKGSDYGSTADPRLAEELRAVREVGARFVVTDDKVVDSSTRAANILLAERRSPDRSGRENPQGQPTAMATGSAQPSSGAGW